MNASATPDRRILEFAEEYCRFSQLAANQQILVFIDPKTYGSAFPEATATELKLLLSKLGPLVSAAIEGGNSPAGNEEVVRAVTNILGSIARRAKNSGPLFRAFFMVFLGIAEELAALAETDASFARENSALYYRWPNLNPAIRKLLGPKTIANVHKDRGPHMTQLEGWVDRFIIERENFILFKKISDRNELGPNGLLEVRSPWRSRAFEIPPFDPDWNACIKQWSDAVLGGIETHDPEFISYKSLGPKKSVRKKNAKKHIERILSSRFKMGVFKVDPWTKKVPHPKETAAKQRVKAEGGAPRRLTPRS